MTEHDRDNLNFLLKCSEESLRDWYEQASEDDRAYANELLDAYEEEIKVKLKKIDKYFPDPASATIH